jgi:hypothetical protein
MADHLKEVKPGDPLRIAAATLNTRPGKDKR